jgi:acyl dehydratase
MPKFEDLEVGQVIATHSYEISRDSLVRYAGASGDFNPIHYRDDFAQAVGLPGVLAHGMLTMGLSVQPVVSWLQDAGRVIDYGVRFTKPVLVSAEGTSVLSVIATIGQVDAENQKARVDLTTSFGELTVLGKAQVWVQF